MTDSIFTPLNLPKAPLKIQKNKLGQHKVWEPIRKKWLVLTPEEWVRMHVVFYLKEHFGVPFSYMNTEYGIQSQGQQQRCDILVTSESLKPFLLVECKAPKIPVNDKVANQICNYNYMIGAHYLFLTNGIQHLFYQLDKEGGMKVVANLPKWKLLTI